MKKRKLALVMSGGGMRCVYGVGVLAALVEEYGLTEPDIVVASSGSVANTAYYLSGQYTSVIAAWLTLLADKKFISYGRWKIMDIDYLVDDGFKKQYPFDFKKLAHAKTLFFFAVTRVRDGKTIFMRLPRVKTVYECLRAATAVPFVYNKEVRIGKDSYIDGDFGSNTEDLIAKAAALGADDIIVVENNPSVKGSQRKRLILNTLYAEAKARGKTGIAAAMLRELGETGAVTLPKRARIVTLQPTKDIVAILEHRKSKLRSGFNQGYDDAVTSKELRKLLS